MKAWIARDKTEEVYLYNKQPIKLEKTESWYANGYCFELHKPFLDVFTNNINPQWSDDEPIEVELKIERV